MPPAARQAQGQAEDVLDQLGQPLAERVAAVGDHQLGVPGGALLPLVLKPLVYGAQRRVVRVDVRLVGHRPGKPVDDGMAVLVRHDRGVEPIGARVPARPGNRAPAELVGLREGVAGLADQVELVVLGHPGVVALKQHHGLVGEQREFDGVKSGRPSGVALGVIAGVRVDPDRGVEVAGGEVVEPDRLSCVLGEEVAVDKQPRAVRCAAGAVDLLVQVVGLVVGVDLQAGPVQQPAGDHHAERFAGADREGDAAHLALAVGGERVVVAEPPGPVQSDLVAGGEPARAD